MSCEVRCLTHWMKVFCQKESGWPNLISVAVPEVPSQGFRLRKLVPLLGLDNSLAVTRGYEDPEAHGYAKRAFGFQPNALKEYVLMFYLAPFCQVPAK